MDWRRWWLVSFLACLAYLFLTVLGVFPTTPAASGAPGAEFTTQIIERELGFATIFILFMNGTIYGLISYAKKRQDLRFISIPFRKFWEGSEERKHEALRRSAKFMYASLSYLNVSILFFLFMALNGFINRAPWIVFTVVGLSSGALIGYGLKVFKPDQSLK